MIRPTLPANPEAEEAVLGSLLIDPDAIIGVAASLTPDDFYREKNSWIYKALLDLHERREPADFVTLVDELERRNQIQQIGGTAYIASLINSVPTAIHAEHYAHIVERAAFGRRLIAAGTAIVGMGYNEEKDRETLQAEAQRAISSLAQTQGNGPQSMRTLMGPALQRIEEIEKAQGALLGVSSGYEQIDQLLGGFQAGELYILAARPGAGKSALALNMAVRAAKKGYRIGFFSLEMSVEQLVLRTLSTESGVDYVPLTRGFMDEAAWSKVIAAAGILADIPLYIDDTPGLSPVKLHALIQRLMVDGKLDLVIVDYLQLMYSDRRHENRTQEVSALSRALKTLCTELKLPILALSQMSRAIEQRQDHKPVLSDLRESGSLEQDASVVMFIYREDLVNEASTRANIADVIVAKNRHGPMDTASLYFDGTRLLFADLEISKTPLE